MVGTLLLAAAGCAAPSRPAAVGSRQPGPASAVRRSARTSTSPRSRHRRRRPSACASAAGSSTTRGCPRDGTVACATCHRPEHAFSEPTPVSTGIRGQKGRRKAPTFINQAVTLYPHFFWDGRASSLEDQALGPIANPIEMGNTHAGDDRDAVARCRATGRTSRRRSARDEITKERVAQAIADYERTRMSGNSPYDRWRCNRDQNAVSAAGEAGARAVLRQGRLQPVPPRQQLHRQPFHNLGVGWDAGDEDVQGRGPLRRHQGHGESGERSRRVQDADAARGHASTRPTCTTARWRRCARSSSSTTAAATRTRSSIRRCKPLRADRRRVDALVAFMQCARGRGLSGHGADELPAVARVSGRP